MKYMNEISDKFIDYINYITEHRNNVLKAWQEMQEKCKDEKFIYDDWMFYNIDGWIKLHDLSKFSQEEFTQYRLNFFPCEEEQRNREEFELAVKHHYENNDHHWQYWVNEDGSFKKGDTSFHRGCSYVEMICDWQSMGYKFGDNALYYYNECKGNIKIADDSIEFVERILNKLCV